MRIHDISVPLSPDLATWPGHDPMAIRHLSTHAERGVQTSMVAFGQHAATHVDAPCHFIEGGDDIASLALEPFVGPAQVIDCTGAPTVSGELLEARVPAGATRLLFRTDNTRHWPGTEFRDDYVGVDESGAEWLAGRDRLVLVGNDYLSVATRSQTFPVHQKILGAGISVLEGISLVDVEPGDYWLFAPPVALSGGDGAPARALLLSSTEFA